MNRSTLLKAMTAGLALGAVMILISMGAALAQEGLALELLYSMLYPLSEPNVKNMLGLLVVVLQIALPLILCGSDMAKDLYQSAPYRMTREDSRIWWYVRAVCTMLVAAFLYVGAYALAACGASCLVCALQGTREQIGSIVRLGAVFVASMGVCMSVLMLLMAVMAVMGSAGSMLAISVALALGLFMLAIAASGSPAAWARALFAVNPICCGMAVWYGVEELNTGAVALLEWAGIAGWGWSRVRRRDIL